MPGASKPSATDASYTSDMVSGCTVVNAAAMTGPVRGDAVECILPNPAPRRAGGRAGVSRTVQRVQRVRHPRDALA